MLRPASRKSNPRCRVPTTSVASTASALLLSASAGLAIFRDPAGRTTTTASRCPARGYQFVLCRSIIEPAIETILNGENAMTRMEARPQPTQFNSASSNTTWATRLSSRRCSRCSRTKSRRSSPSANSSRSSNAKGMSRRGFALQPGGGYAPYWFPALVAGTLGALGIRAPYRFSLATLLIVTALVAVVLGTGVVASSVATWTAPNFPTCPHCWIAHLLIVMR